MKLVISGSVKYSLLYIDCQNDVMEVLNDAIYYIQSQPNFSEAYACLGITGGWGRKALSP